MRIDAPRRWTIGDCRMLTPWIYVKDHLPHAGQQNAILTLVSVAEAGGRDYVTAAFFYPEYNAWLDERQPMNV